MSLVEKLCKELGVEIGEEWKATDGKHYYIDSRGYLVNKTEEGHIYTDWIERVLSGELEPTDPTWEPKHGDSYFIPTLSEEDKYAGFVWMDMERDIKNRKKNIVFKTKEEAINMTEKILNFIKEER